MWIAPTCRVFNVDIRTLPRVRRTPCARRPPLLLRRTLLQDLLALDRVRLRGVELQYPVVVLERLRLVACVLVRLRQPDQRLLVRRIDEDGLLEKRDSAVPILLLEIVISDLLVRRCGALAGGVHADGRLEPNERGRRG